MADDRDPIDRTPEGPGTPQSAPTPEGDDVPRSPATAPVPSTPLQPAAPSSAQVAVAATDQESVVRDVEHAQRAARTRAAATRRAALLGLRFATGAIGVAAAVATVVAVGVVPVPGLTVEPAGTTIVPVPADQLRVCAGAALRLGDETGQDAGTASAVGAPELLPAAVGEDVSSAPIEGPSTPTGLTLPAGEGVLLGGAQSQVAGTGELAGLAAAACGEPTSSAWLVGGATTVGRTTLLTLSNPTDVDAAVSLRILGENGAVTAPGLSGIIIAPGTQRVLPIAGFARDLAAPVVEVESRGGRVVPFLQQSTLRAVDPGGLDIVGPTAGPSTEAVIPGVLLRDSEDTARALSREGYQDLASAVRIAVPGDTAAQAQITVSLEGGDAADDRVSEIELPAGQVTEVPLEELADGRYTVTVSADQPVVAAARTSSTGAADPADRLDAPETDFGWFVAAPRLDDEVLVTVPVGPGPRLTLHNPGEEEVSVTSTDTDTEGEAVIEVPPRSSATVSAPSGAYRLSGMRGLRATVTLATTAQLAAFAIAPAQPASEPLVVRP